MKTTTLAALTEGKALILCNNMQKRLYNTMELVQGSEEAEVFQYYIIDENLANYLVNNTDLVIFNDNELDLYILGIETYGMLWEDIKVELTEYKGVTL